MANVFFNRQELLNDADKLKMMRNAFDGMVADFDLNTEGKVLKLAAEAQVELSQIENEALNN